MRPSPGTRCQRKDDVLPPLQKYRVPQDLSSGDRRRAKRQPAADVEICRRHGKALRIDRRLCRDRGNLEETVKREVMEEVGLKVKNIEYYKSQPWSLSSSLLMGFYCDLEGSDQIVLEEDELSEAQWFEREEIPYDDYDVSLTREMMIRFKKGLA